VTEPLRPAALRLRGSALIEASAGTGKTWTIAALYLRLVLGHGDVVTRVGRPLVPAEILVMTFTRAATRELQERIRDRLVQAAAVFRGHGSILLQDEFLVELLAAYPEGAARETAAWRLERAAQGMDEAAIHTLDAWCQRVLRDRASTPELSPGSEVLPDSHDLRLEAARDVWRQQVYPLDRLTLQAVQQVWSEPEQMAREAELVADKALPNLPAASSWSTVVASSVDALAKTKSAWRQRTEDIEAWLMPRLMERDPPFKKNLIAPDKLQSWLEALRTWALDPLAERPTLPESAWRRLTPQGVREALKAGTSLPALPGCFEDFETLQRQLRELQPRATLLRALAAHQVEERLQALKRQGHLQNHVDLQRALDEALNADEQGERAVRWRAQLLDHYPAALVDEFQDTSPLQLSILDRLYRIRDNDPDSLLLLIGDPKQSIYAFRGADIHSYLRARDAVPGRQYALQKNFRSSEALVTSVNTMFAEAEQREGLGAFKFGSLDGGKTKRLPFVPVAAAGRADTLLLAENPGPAITLCVEGPISGAVSARKRFAAHCARAIRDLLSGQGTRFVQPGRPDCALRPADVAVLVRSHVEATQVREALDAVGLPSVFLSDRDSVFAAPEAADLLRLLQAIAAPRDMRLTRAALATELLGLSLQQLQALADDEDAFETQAARLLSLSSVWHRQGLVGMVRAFLHRFELPGRWLLQAGGERRLTNLLHVSELVQEAEGSDRAPSAQIRWLSRQIADALAGVAASEERVLRLESDADRVQVVTVHKSKGLEYPVVFLPFATQVRSAQNDRAWALWLVDDDGGRRVVLDPTDADRAQADLEQQREDLRLLYVALTRARHAIWVGASLHTVGSSKALSWHRSALGFLLTGAEPCEAAVVQQALAALTQRCPSIRLLHATADHGASTAPVPPWTDGVARRPMRPLEVYAATFERQWTVASYSSLVRDPGGTTAAPRASPADTAEADEADTSLLWLAESRLRRDEPEAAADVAPSLSAGAGQAWHRFPRGALAGDFLHGQLEWLAGEGFALADNPGLQQALRRRCERQGWGHRSDEVQAWLERVCCQTLPPLQVSLQHLGRALPELEFWLPSDGLTTDALDDLCSRHCLPGQRRRPLSQRQLSGLLMGFADLVFEHQGRYWVLDYKSNALGDDDHAYTHGALERAVLAHRYDVQAALYLLPLHRLLRRRLGAAYRPSHHLGGAISMFLRGIAAANAGCLVLPAVPALLEELDALLPTGTQAAGARS
jgi:exodeoxyribonuclease V beta subunit